MLKLEIELYSEIDKILVHEWNTWAKKQLVELSTETWEQFLKQIPGVLTAKSEFIPASYDGADIGCTTLIFNDEQAKNWFLLKYG